MVPLSSVPILTYSNDGFFIFVAFFFHGIYLSLYNFYDASQFYALINILNKKVFRMLILEFQSVFNLLHVINRIKFCQSFEVNDRGYNIFANQSVIIALFKSPFIGIRLGYFLGTSLIIIEF